MFKKSALDIWSEECNNGTIISLCKSLDTALGNGIPLQAITELCSPPGCGKTQIWYKHKNIIKFKKLYI